MIMMYGIKCVCLLGGPCRAACLLHEPACLMHESCVRYAAFIHQSWLQSDSQVSCACGCHVRVGIMRVWVSCACGHHVRAGIMCVWVRHTPCSKERQPT